MQRGLSDNLRQRIDELLLVESGKGNPVWVYQQCVQILIGSIFSVKNSLQSEGFANDEEEVWFFKEEAPVIWGLYLYYRRLVKIEVWRKCKSLKKFRQLLQRELRLAEQFPDRHDVCEYYYQGRTDCDELYFMRKHREKSIENELDMFLDVDFTIHAYWLSKMRAYEQLRVWLSDALDEVEYQLTEGESRKKLECTLSPTEAVELFKGLHEIKCFKDKSFKEVMCWVKEMMNIKTDNFNIILQNIRDRKSNRTTVIDRVRDGLEKYFDRKR